MGLKRSLFLLGAAMTIVTLMAACGNEKMAATSHPARLVTGTPSPTASLLPPYAATAQAMQLHNQATIAAAQVMQQAAAMTATVVALDIQRAQATQNAWATATVQAYQATATAQAQAGFATATAQAWNLQATATAQAAVEAQAQARVTATAQALALQATATAQNLAAQATMQAAEATAQALHAQATAQFAEAERIRVAKEREAAMAGAWKVGKFIAATIGFLVVVGIGIWLAIQAETYRIVRASQNERIILRLGKGWVDPDRNMHPIVVLGPNGNPAIPDTPADAQERTAARAQAVQLAHALPSRAGAPRKALRKASPPAQGAPAAEGRMTFRVLEPTQARRVLPGLVSPEALQVLDADWREVDGHEGSNGGGA